MSISIIPKIAMALPINVAFCIPGSYDAVSLLQIFVLLCQTELEIDSTRLVLTLIRVASFNPILDPWVYILFRRELVWRVVKLCRWLLRLEPLQHPLQFQQSLLLKDPGGGEAVLLNGGGGGKGGGGTTAAKSGRRSGWEDPYDPSCLAFCFQCLCLPPAPRTAHLASQRLSVTTCNTTRSQTSRRASSLEQVSTRSPTRSSSRLVVKPPSPSDRLLLIKMTESGGSSRCVNSMV